MEELQKQKADSEKNSFSCVDCRKTLCGDCAYDPDRAYPGFCPTEMLSQKKRREIMALYDEDSNREIMIAAAEVETEGYCVWPRVEEIMRFAEKIGAHKIGIATCVGLIREAGIFAEILRSRGFAPYGIGCKVGAEQKVDIGIPEKCTEVGVTMCNPVMQAKLLEEAGTQLNVVIGLCVGHDSLFYKYSAAPVTTLVTKDRVTGHNPAAALYTSKSYYKRLYEEEK